MKRTKVMFGLLTGLALLLSAERARAALPSTPTLIKSVSSGKCLTDPDFSFSNGTIIRQYDYSGWMNQQWRFFSLGNGYYAIQNCASFKYLDVPGLSTNDGMPIQQYDWNGGLNQQWGVYIMETKLVVAGTFYRVQIYNWNKLNYKYLDIPGSSPYNGANLQQFRWTGGTNQQFWIGPY